MEGLPPMFVFLGGKEVFPSIAIKTTLASSASNDIKMTLACCVAYLINFFSSQSSSLHFLIVWNLNLCKNDLQFNLLSRVLCSLQFRVKGSGHCW